MNLGISNSQVSTWKRIKTHHIAVAAGVALAVSAVVSGASIIKDTGSSPAPRASVPASFRSVPQPQTFIYVVAGQAEATQLEQGLATASLESGSEFNHTVVVADPQNEAAMMGDLMLAANTSTVTVIDLRGGPAVQAIGSQAEFSQVLTPEAEMLSTGMNAAQAPAYSQIIIAEAEILSTGLNVLPSSAQAEYVEVLTPEAEMLSTGMTLP
jgi:hypothetical protein